VGGRAHLPARRRSEPAATKGASRGSAVPMSGKAAKPGAGKAAAAAANGQAERRPKAAEGRGRNGRVPAAAKAGSESKAGAGAKAGAAEAGEGAKAGAGAKAGRTAAAGKAPSAAEGEQAGRAAPAGLRHRWLRRVTRIPVELVVLAVLAAVTRLALLYNPRATAFDEVYFREYALHYKQGTYYFDLHPPLGKLLLAAWAELAGVGATVADKDPALAMRILPAVAGSALIVVFYLFLRQLCDSRRIATLGAGLLLLDNALLVESRFILVDSMLLLFGMGALTLFLAARRRTGRAHWLLLGGGALLAGMAAATKLTGLAALGLMGLCWLVQVLRERPPWRRAAGQGAVLTVVPLLLYVATFAVHFSLLPKAGPGDAYMSQRFQSTLVGNQHHSDAAHMSFPDKFRELNSAIKNYEHSLNDSTHPYSSEWTSWPVMKRGIFYYTDPAAGDDRATYIYLLGNPVVWWGTLLGVVVLGLGWAARPGAFAAHRGSLAFLGAGWAGSYLPFALIERPMFLYHYFFPLMFSLATVVIGVGALAGWLSEPGGLRARPFAFRSRGSAVAYWGILGVALLAFLYFAPLSYGLPLTTDGLMDRMWISTWR
jgi:dolichyl-phosphate-mannose-protein mannosyltransferase